MAGNANSGRPPLPATVHALRGDPSKKGMAALLSAAQAPVVPVAAPPKPDFLSEEASQEWDRVTAALVSLGWVSTLDMMALASYCEAVADWVRFRRKIAELSKVGDSGDVQTYESGAKQISVWRQLANDAERRANQAGALFGFSPVARRAMKALAGPQGELFPNEQRDAAERYFS